MESKKPNLIAKITFFLNIKRHRKKVLPFYNSDMC